MLRTTAFAATAIALAGIAGLTGCGDQASTDATGTVGVSASASAFQSQTVKAIKEVTPAVGQLQCAEGLGSGIVFDNRGDMVTNAHVVAGGQSCKVTLSGAREQSARVVGRDIGHDLAVVHLDGSTPTPATFGDSDKVQVGDTVLAMGNPLGLTSSVTQGIVSSLNRKVAESSNVELSALIQTSAEINPGNSGGALVNLSGQVVGIPTLTAVDPEFGNTQAPGIGFAIPSNVVRRIASSLIRAG